VLYKWTISPTILATKLFILPPRPKIILRRRIEKLNDGLSLGSKPIILSASAGCDITTLLTEWIADCKRLSTSWINNFVWKF
jgi:LuxR family maltose regulon positive regulatory protein